MTINLADNTPRVSYTVAQGVSQSAFAVSFEFFDDADLNVYVDGTLKTLTTDYTTADDSGNTQAHTSGTTGYIHFVSAVVGATGGSTVVITRSIALERTTDFPASGAFQIDALNTGLDKIIAISSDLSDSASRGLRLQDYDESVSVELPVKDDRKGKTLVFDATTGAPAAGPTIADTQSVADASADIATLADIQDGTVATNAITTAASISSDISTVSGVSANVTTVAGQTTNMQNVTDNLTAIQNAATNATNAATSATNAATSETNAATSETNAASSASSASTSASNSATSATASAASATAAAASETAAAASETAASTSETNAATSETNAASSASSASTSASAASTSASNASTSASNAATSETNAATSATAAAASQTAAAASAASAASAYDSFDDRYLGVKASDPTVDNDGDPLSSGLLYFSSSENIMKVYDGASWIAATSAGNVSLLTYQYTATASQTTFSGSDDNAATLSYTVNNILVTLNGSLLYSGTDYTATNGTSIVLASGAASGDVLQVTAFKSFTTADMVPASTGGTFSGNIDVTGTVTADGLTVDSTTSTSITSTNGNVLNLYRSGTGSDSVAINLYDGSSDRSQIKSADGGLSFHINGTTRAVDIDSGGNVGIGKSAYGSISTDGFWYESGSSKYLVLGTTGSSPLYLNRNGSDGGIINFYKSGTTVGSIGAWSSSLLMGTGDVGLAFVDGTPERIQPRKADDQTSADGLIDLGHTSNRFKDLYLSGGVYLGGTGSANYLDDYEEGTWTPAFCDASSGGNEFGYTGAVEGRYTKVGSMVTVWFYGRTDGSTTGITTSNQLFIQGLPFTVNMSSNGTFAFVRSSTQGTLQATTGPIIARLNNGATYLTMEKQFGDTSAPYSTDSLLISEWEGGYGANITGFVSYKTDS